MVISINGIEKEVPQSWNELSLKQQLAIYHIFYENTFHFARADQDVIAKRIAVAQQLLNINDAFLTRWNRSRLEEYGDEGDTIFYSELEEVLKVTDWLFEKLPEEDGKPQLYQVRLGLTRCPWPVLERTKKGGKKKYYYAPADGLENLSFYELGVTFNLFEKFVTSKEIDTLDELLATLYRPPKEKTKYNKQSGYEGDIRQPLLKHESMVTKRRPHFAQLPKQVKQLLLFWFASCRQAIINSFPNIFEQSAGLAGDRAGNDYAWGGVMLGLAEGIIHLDAVSAQPWQNALTYLSYLEDERKKKELERAKQRQRSR